MKRGELGDGHRQAMTCGVVALCMILTCFLPETRSRAAKPTESNSVELVGPLAPSIHVPPVRNAPPKLTRPIVRPPQYDATVTAQKQTLSYKMESLRLAIDDLIATHGPSYVNGPAYQRRWRVLRRAADENRAPAPDPLPRDSRGAGQGEGNVESAIRLKQAIDQHASNLQARFRQLRGDALLANPLLDFGKLLVLKRKKGQLGLPTNHQCMIKHQWNDQVLLVAQVPVESTVQEFTRPVRSLIDIVVKFHDSLVY